MRGWTRPGPTSKRYWQQWVSLKSPFGRSSSLIGTMTMQLAQERGVDHVALDPTQLYSATNGLPIFTLLMLLQPWHKKRGAMFGMLCVLYAIGRFTIDFFRYYEPNAGVLGGLSFNQVICVFVFFFGVFLVARKERAPATS